MSPFSIRMCDLQELFMLKWEHTGQNIIRKAVNLSKVRPRLMNASEGCTQLPATSTQQLYVRPKSVISPDYKEKPVGKTLD